MSTLTDNAIHHAGQAFNRHITDIGKHLTNGDEGIICFRFDLENKSSGLIADINIQYDLVFSFRITSYNVCYTKLLRLYSCILTNFSVHGVHGVQGVNSVNTYCFRYLFTAPSETPNSAEICL